MNPRTAVAGVLALLCCTAFADTLRWPEKKAADWYAAQRWLVGSDYIPADAINQELCAKQLRCDDRRLAVQESGERHTAL